MWYNTNWVLVVIAKRCVFARLNLMNQAYFNNHTYFNGYSTDWNVARGYQNYHDMIIQWHFQYMCLGYGSKTLKIKFDYLLFAEFFKFAYLTKLFLY